MKKKAKTRKVAKPAEPKKINFQDRLPNNHGEWLKVVIKLTEKGIAKHNSIGLDGQLERLKTELKDWEAANL